MAAGYNGVTLFFVLSGFVLAWNYGERLSRPSVQGLRSFAVARLARIYPLYLLALLFAASPAFFVGGVTRDLWLHVFALQAWHPDVFQAFAYNGPGWSIGIEFFLYGCFPILMPVMARLRHRPVALVYLAVGVGAAMALLSWWFVATGRADLPTTDPDSAHRWLYRTPLSRLGDFVVGMACALFIQARPQLPARIGVRAQVLGSASIVAFMAWPRVLFTAWSWDVACMVPAALLLWGLGAAPGSGLARLLRTPVMVLLGEASFAFYLFHVPMLQRLAYTGVDTVPGWMFATAMQFVVITLVAVGAHVLVERPAQRWLRRVLDRRPRQQVAAADGPLAPMPEPLNASPVSAAPGQ